MGYSELVQRLFEKWHFSCGPPNRNIRREQLFAIFCSSESAGRNKIAEKEQKKQKTPSETSVSKNSVKNLSVYSNNKIDTSVKYVLRHNKNNIRRKWIWIEFLASPDLERSLTKSNKELRQAPIINLEEPKATQPNPDQFVRPSVRPSVRSLLITLRKIAPAQQIWLNSLTAIRVPAGTKSNQKTPAP